MPWSIDCRTTSWLLQRLLRLGLLLLLRLWLRLLLLRVLRHRLLLR